VKKVPIVFELYSNYAHFLLFGHLEYSFDESYGVRSIMAQSQL
jgi:hypothetical protein